MDDTRVVDDEARRVAQHASVKTQIEGSVNAEIRGRAQSATAEQSDRVRQVADEFRGRAIDEALASEHDVARSRGVARVSQYLDYVFYLIFALLTARLVLALIAASPSNAFVQLINAVTYPLYVPFRGIVPSPTVPGGFSLALPVVIAIIAYGILHSGVTGMLRLVANRKTTI